MQDVIDVRQSILDALRSVAEEQQLELIGDISDSTVRLRCGLDSLGFAILVVELEEVLGYDPFQIADEALYPTTFKEFVDIYEKFNPST